MGHKDPDPIDLNIERKKRNPDNKRWNDDPSRDKRLKRVKDGGKRKKKIDPRFIDEYEDEY